MGAIDIRTDPLPATPAELVRVMQASVEPRALLEAFSDAILEAVPHDRLVIAMLDEARHTGTIFAEHAVRGSAVGEPEYAKALDAQGRFAVDELATRAVFGGEPLRIGDLQTEPRWRELAAAEQRSRDAGARAVLGAPLVTPLGVVGALYACSARPNAFSAEQLEQLVHACALIAPAVHNAHLVLSERARRARLAELVQLNRELGASLDLRSVFERLAHRVRPLLDCDVMGLLMLDSGRTEWERLARVDLDQQPGAMPRMPVDGFSFAARSLAGEVVVLSDTRADLDPALPGDSQILANGARAGLIVPLQFGTTVEGIVYFAKRRPHWFGAQQIELGLQIAAQLVLVLQLQKLAEDQRAIALERDRAARLEQRVDHLQRALGERFGFDQMVGRSQALRAALDLAQRVAPNETSVLVTGESGTGKELVARAIHAASPRSAGPFLALNCAALPETLIESELFGHERGAFTGADKLRAGRFELAAGGTLFLDEIGELPLGAQSKLLRVLQEHEFQRVGGTLLLRADVRLIAATNRDLKAEVEAGRFRRDLYYRLAVFGIHLPPLRERGEDVLLLADAVVQRLQARMGRRTAGLSREARDALLAHDWPGNIRELENAIERALIVSDGSLVAAEDLGLPPPGTRRTTSPSAAPTAEAAAEAALGAPALALLERRMVEDALTAAKGNKSRAAKLLGLTRAQLYTRMKRHELPL
jgi:transcriptional regulator with GAF, ATPase, and Fis domain